jgi:hypothetical protein
MRDDPLNLSDNAGVGKHKRVTEEPQLHQELTAFILVRPAGRMYLEVKVLYGP